MLQDLKSFYLSVDDTNSMQLYSGSEFSIVFPDKIRLVSILGPSKIIKILNNGKYLEDSELNVDGQVYSERKMGRTPSKPRMPSYIEEALPKDKVEFLKNNPDELNKLLLEENFWIDVFPILLTNPLNANVKYEYVGKAESPTQKADIVDIKSDFFRKIRLFFDENTHLLLMMTSRLDLVNSEVTEKFYFSNYELANGIMVAKGIKKESESVAKDGSGKKSYGPRQSVIKEVKINSNLKANLFNE